ncbi:MAG: hypothetical protein WD512_07805 [Candidatus Paceibacterota bacterium]
MILIFLVACTVSHPQNLAKEKQAQTLNIQGLQALRENKTKEAQANFYLAYQLFPNPESLDGLGVCQINLKNFRSAQTIYILAYQEDPNYYNSLINLAFLYEQYGYHDLAEKIYQDLILKYPENYKLQNNFSVFLFDYYGQQSIDQVELRLLQAKSMSSDPKILRNLQKVIKDEY